jgi:hypothetical protein
MLQLPGVIVRIVNDTGIVAPPAYERYPVIIGEGDPWKLISGVEMTKGTPGGTDLIPTMTSVHSIDMIYENGNSNSPKYVGEYTLTGNYVDWAGATSEPVTGESYYITYTETRAASAYEPILYFDENLIFEDHGYNQRTNNAINDASAGGSLALQAGARGVIVLQLDLRSAVDPDSPSASELENAFIASVDKLETITDFKLFLIPMSSGIISTTTAADIMFNHATLASMPENKQERTVISPVPIGTSPVTAAIYAQTYAHERMVVPFTYRGACQVTGIERASSFVNETYDTRFYCAAIAGKLCSSDIGVNISDEIIPNIVVAGNYGPKVMQQMVQSGVGPSKIRGTVLRNVYIGTTDTTNALTEDLGVQDTKDYVKKYWRDGLWPLYKNKPINSSLLASIHSSSVGILDSLISRNIIDQYKNVSVRQDTQEPRKVFVTGKVKPAFSLQFIDVTFTFVLSF